MITHYLRWRCENDRQKDVFHTYKTSIKLSNWHHDKNTGVVRALPVDPVSKFVFKHKGAGVTSRILSFFGEKRGDGDLRGATKERLLELGLQEKVLRRELKGIEDWGNQFFWGVRVDSNGDVVDDEE